MQPPITSEGYASQTNPSVNITGASSEPATYGQWEHGTHYFQSTLSVWPSYVMPSLVQIHFHYWSVLGVAGGNLGDKVSMYISKPNF